LVAPVPSFAANSDVVPDPALKQIDRSLFVELSQLARFNIHFHLDANRHQPWRDFTYPLGREAGTGLSFAATLVDLNQQAKGLDNPRRINRNQLKNAVACSIVGNSISGGASALELAQNAWVMLSARQHGYSPSSSLAFVKGVIARTDELLTARDKLALQQPEQAKAVMQLESQLVRRIRQQLIFEFGTWSCYSREQACSENTFYTIDALQSFTKTGAGIVTMKAFGHPRLGRGAAVSALVANSVATVNPIVRNVVGILIRKHQHRLLSREIPFSRPMDSPELENLQETLSAEGGEDWLRRVAALHFRTEKIDIALDREMKEIRRYRQIAQQQSISGPIIGLTGVASSTLATTALYGYSNDPHTAIRLGFAGRISQGAGQSFALLNTPYTAVRGILRNRDLAKRGELPTQILQARLKRLEAQ
jgi:hypothetical protein